MSGNGRDSDPELVCATDIEPVATDWWWPGWLPKRKLVLLDGNPGTGKSTLSLDVAARLSRGESFPTTGTTIRCRTAVLSTEDATDDTIRPRLDAAGAQVEMIDLWNWESPMPSFPKSCDWLEPAIIEREHRNLAVEVATINRPDQQGVRGLRCSFRRVKRTDVAKLTLAGAYLSARPLPRRTIQTETLDGDPDLEELRP